MNFFKAYNNFFKKYFPSPLTIALLLTIISFILAWIFTAKNANTNFYGTELMNYWFSGMFKSSLLAFTIHMMLILVLGHIIALSKPAEKVIDWVLKFCTNTASSVFLVSLLTILVSLFNWGFGLIFGAIFARKIGDKFKKEHKAINYPLVVAVAYIGMMVWHGGLSGSAPLTVAGATHTYVNEIGVISLQKTLFSSMNIVATLIVVFIIPLVLYFFAKQTKNTAIPNLKKTHEHKILIENENALADKFELKPYLSILVGAVMLLYFVYLSYSKVKEGGSVLSILNLETTNLLLLSLAILLHGNIKNFLFALEESISDVSGILIQFPLYFGIMGIINGSGLAVLIANAFTEISNNFTLPLFTFLSAGLLNIFIPSGGGQWQVQAPIIIASAKNTGVSIEKLIMAMSYGDQLTNMLQPFWALPLLGITQLKAKDILPYTLLLFVLGLIIFTTILIIF